MKLNFDICSFIIKTDSEYCIKLLIISEKLKNLYPYKTKLKLKNLNKFK